MTNRICGMRKRHEREWVISRKKPMPNRRNRRTKNIRLFVKKTAQLNAARTDYTVPITQSINLIQYKSITITFDPPHQKKQNNLN